MSLSSQQTLALALDPALLFELRGLTPDLLAAGAAAEHGPAGFAQLLSPGR